MGGKINGTGRVIPLPPVNGTADIDDNSMIRHVDSEREMPESQLMTSEKSLNARSASPVSIADSGVGDDCSSRISYENKARLRAMVADDTEASESLEKCLLAADCFDDIEGCLTDDLKMPAERQAFLSQSTGLFSHMTRKERPTPPSVVVSSLDDMMQILNELAESRVEVDQILKGVLDTSSGICCEVRMRNVYGEYSKYQSIAGIGNENVINLGNGLDHDDSIGKILQNKTIKYMNE